MLSILVLAAAMSSTPGFEPRMSSDQSGNLGATWWTNTGRVVFSIDGVNPSQTLQSSFGTTPRSPDVDVVGSTYAVTWSSIYSGGRGIFLACNSVGTYYVGEGTVARVATCAPWPATATNSIGVAWMTGGHIYGDSGYPGAGHNTSKGIGGSSVMLQIFSPNANTPSKVSALTQPITVATPPYYGTLNFGDISADDYGNFWVSYTVCSQYNNTTAHMVSSYSSSGLLLSTNTVDSVGGYYQFSSNECVTNAIRFGRAQALPPGLVLSYCYDTQSLWSKEFDTNPSTGSLTQVLGTYQHVGPQIYETLAQPGEFGLAPNRVLKGQFFVPWVTTTSHIGAPPQVTNVYYDEVTGGSIGLGAYVTNVNGTAPGQYNLPTGSLTRSGTIYLDYEDSPGTQIAQYMGPF